MTKRWSTLLLCIFGFYFVAGKNSDLAVSLAKYFGTHHVIIVKRDEAFNSVTTVQMGKSLMAIQNHLFVTVLKFETLLKMLQEKLPTASRMMALTDSEDLSSNEFLQLTQKVDISPLAWAVLTSSGQVEFLRGVRIPFNCRLVLAEKNRSSDYAVTEVFSSTGNGLEFQPVRPAKTNETTKPKPYRNLGGEAINVSSIGKETCKDRGLNRGIRSTVMCIHLMAWRVLVDMLNLTTVFVQDPQDEIMFVDRVKNYGVEVSFHNLVLVGRFLDDHSFLWPTWNNALQVFTAYLGQAFEWKTFIRPYSPGIWFCVGGTIAVFASVATLLDRFRPLPERFDYTFLSLMAFCNQGASETPKKSNYRVLFLLAFAVPTILVPAYCAVLTSFLTIKVLHMPFTDLDGLAATKDHKIGCVPPWDMGFYLKENPTETFKKLVSRNLLPMPEMPKDEKEGARRMCKGKFSFVYVPASDMTKNPPCPFYKLEKPFLVTVSAMPIKKGSPFKRYLDHCLRAMHFSGVMEAIKDRETNYIFKRKAGLKSKGVTPITFQNTVLLSSFLLLGIIVSSVFLLFEIYGDRFLDKAYRRK